MSNKLIIFGSKWKNCLVEKGHAWKEPGVMTQGKSEVEVGTLLQSNDENNLIAKNVLSYF